MIKVELGEIDDVEAQGSDSDASEGVSDVEDQDDFKQFEDLLDVTETETEMDAAEVEQQLQREGEEEKKVEDEAAGEKDDARREPGAYGEVDQRIPDERPSPPSPPEEPKYEEVDYKKLLEDFFTKYKPEKKGTVDSILAKKNTAELREKEFAKLARKYNCDDPLKEEKVRLEEVNLKLKNDHRLAMEIFEKEMQEWRREQDALKDEKGTTAGKDGADDEAGAKQSRGEEDVGDGKKKEKEKEKEKEIPADLLRVVKHVERVMPKSSAKVAELSSQISSLEEEFEWANSEIATAWEAAATRLSELDVKKERSDVEAYASESKAFGELRASRELMKRRTESEAEVHRAAIEVQREVVQEAIKGVWEEVNSIDKFIQGTVSEAIFAGLPRVNGNRERALKGEGGLRASLWHATLRQLQEDRKERDRNTFGENVCLRTQQLSEHFINASGEYEGVLKNGAESDDDMIRRVKQQQQQQQQGVRVVTDAGFDELPAYPLSTKLAGSDLESFKLLEESMWKMVKSKKVVLPLRKKCGNVSKIAVGAYSTSGGFEGRKVTVAVGTSTGALLVYRVDPKGAEEPVLVRFMNNLPKAEQSPVTEIQLSSDSTSQILVTHEAGIVRRCSLDGALGGKDKKVSRSMARLGQGRLKF